MTKRMNRFFNVVALTLLLTIGGIPLLACVSSPNKTSGMHCSLDCPMMTKTAQAPVFGAAKTPMSCCNLSSGKPVPVAELQVPTSAAVLVLQPDEIVVGSSLVSLHVERDVDVPIPDTASAQSLLCTFLI